MSQRTKQNKVQWFIKNPVIKWFSKLQNRLTFLFGGLALTVAIAVALYIGQAATQIIVQERGKELTSIANGLARNLGQTINERMREVRLLSKRSELVRSDLSADIVKQQLDLVKQNYPYYAWIGVANKNGTVTAAGNQLLEGQSVAQRPWFNAGLKGDYIGDAHEAVLLAKELPNESPNEPLRFIDFASPIYSPDGEVRGVVATHALWSWVLDVIQDFLPDDEFHESIDVLILNQQGQIIHPFSAINNLALPSKLPKSGHFTSSLWEEEIYLTSVENVDTNQTKGLGWQIVVRQPQSAALKNVYQLQKTITFAGLVVVLIAVALSYWLANRFSRPIEHLVKVANRIEQGHEDTPVQIRTGLYELRRLSHSLRGMTNTLIRRKHKLEKNNALLEERVKQRTAELAQANRELEHSVRHDPLTGIFNRLAFNEALEKEFKRMQRNRSLFSIILVDIDKFKQVNDSYGHSTGDEVLIEVAQTIQKTTRETDVVARLGGEEFVVLLPDTANNASVVAEKIRAAIAEIQHPKVKQVTISAGVATAQLIQTCSEEVLNNADKMMYQAKESGRNRVKVRGD